MAGVELHGESEGARRKLRGCVCCCPYGEMQLEVQQMGGIGPSGKAGRRRLHKQDSRRLAPPQMVANELLLRTERFGVVAAGVSFAVSCVGEVVS
jgi:hypothetical protein